MTKKEWEKIIKFEMRKAFNLANKERIRGDRLTTEFFLGYRAGLKYALAAMKGDIIIPEIKYYMEDDDDREEER